VCSFIWSFGSKYKEKANSSKLSSRHRQRTTAGTRDRLRRPHRYDLADIRLKAAEAFPGVYINATFRFPGKEDPCWKRYVNPLELPRSAGYTQYGHTDEECERNLRALK